MCYQHVMSNMIGDLKNESECDHENTTAVTQPIGGGETIVVARLCEDCPAEL